MKSRKFFFIVLLSLLFFSYSLAKASEVPFYKSKQTLRIGMSGWAVYELQTYLVGLGIYPADLVTGYFGTITKLAVRVFQLRNGIEGVGIVGPQTREKISSLVIARNILVNSSIEHLPPPLMVATSSDIGGVVLNISTSSEPVVYSLLPKPTYDLKKLAKDVQNLVNEKRQEFNLNPVYWDEEISFVAEEHSKDQARDNSQLTNPDIVCHYPIIRHEGFTSAGYSLKERFESRNIKYRYGGENIAMVPFSKKILYSQRSDEPVVKCLEPLKFLPGEGTIEDRTALFQTVFKASLQAIKDLKLVEWVNREWESDREIAEVTVNGWMNSPGHRENILRKDFTLGGIGIVSVNDYIIVTHDFVGR